MFAVLNSKEIMEGNIVKYKVVLEILLEWKN